MNADEILLDVEDRMEKAVAKLKQNLSGIRTGYANPGLVDAIKVEAYGGVPVQLKQLATVSCPESNQILIRPFDPETSKAIEKAIVASDLGYTPNNDGRVIRINIPKLSTEVRQKMVAQIWKFCEEAKVAVRNVRRDGNKVAEQLTDKKRTKNAETRYDSNKVAEQPEKKSIFSEDDRDAVKEEIQKLTKRFEDEANELAKNREKDVQE
ncbi:MAG: ribosome-recycling factor [Planctomycetaceae bacterium]|jgi:ribosome recycling factor|nr:ribosome-recycling factor [Planctomycetaceae bacterium]